MFLFLLTTETTYWKKTPRAGVSEYYKKLSNKILPECKRLCRDENMCRSFTWTINRNCYLSKSVKLSQKKPSYNYYELVVVDGMYLYFYMLTFGVMWRCLLPDADKHSPRFIFGHFLRTINLIPTNEVKHSTTVKIPVTVMH